MLSCCGSIRISRRASCRAFSSSSACSRAFSSASFLIFSASAFLSAPLSGNDCGGFSAATSPFLLPPLFDFARPIDGFFVGDAGFLVAHGMVASTFGSAAASSSPVPRAGDGERAPDLNAAGDGFGERGFGVLSHASYRLTAVVYRS